MNINTPQGTIILSIHSLYSLSLLSTLSSYQIQQLYDVFRVSSVEPPQKLYDLLIILIENNLIDNEPDKIIIRSPIFPMVLERYKHAMTVGINPIAYVIQMLTRDISACGNINDPLDFIVNIYSLFPSTLTPLKVLRLPTTSPIPEPVKSNVVTISEPVKSNVVTIPGPIKPIVSTIQIPVKSNVSTIPGPIKLNMATIQIPVKPSVITIQGPIKPVVSTIQIPIKPIISTVPNMGTQLNVSTNPQIRPKSLIQSITPLSINPTPQLTNVNQYNTLERKCIPIKYPVSGDLSIQTVESKRAHILQNLKAEGFTGENISTQTLNRMFTLYDQDFFCNQLSAALTSKNMSMIFEFSIRLTKTAGKCRVDTKTKTATIIISTKVFQSLFCTGKPNYVETNGFKCFSRIEALQLTFEHELIHLAINLSPTPHKKGDGIYKSHGKFFIALINAYFKQQGTTHTLLKTPAGNAVFKNTPNDEDFEDSDEEATDEPKVHINTKEDFRIGDAVSFELKGAIVTGHVTKVNVKTVTIDTPKGGFRVHFDTITKI